MQDGQVTLIRSKLSYLCLGPEGVDEGTRSRSAGCQVQLELGEKEPGYTSSPASTVQLEVGGPSCVGHHHNLNFKAWSLLLLLVGTNTT